MEYIQRRDASDQIFYNSKFKSIQKLAALKTSLGTRIYFYLLPALMFSPFLFLLAFFYLCEEIWRELAQEYFYHKPRFDRYKRIFQPKSASKVLTVVGYEVYEEEIDSHLSLIQDRSSEGQEALRKKQEEFEKQTNAYRQVGFDKKLLTTHFVIPGKTGSGKTEGIRSIAADVMRNGGGFLFNDGKSDMMMLSEFQTQAKQLGRETSTQVLNFLKPEKLPESNSFSPLGIMHPAKIVEFLGGLIKDGGGGEGNTEYFFNRGKVMLFPVVNATYIRNKYCGEGFSLEKVFDNTSVTNMIILQIAMYVMAKEINDKIRRSEKLSIALSSVTIIARDQTFKEIELLIEYITQNPPKKDMVREIGIEFREIKEIYINAFEPIKTYMESVWNQYGSLLSALGNAIYRMGKAENRAFFGGENIVNINEIKQYYNRIKETMVSKDEAQAKELKAKYDLTVADIRSLFEAFQSQKGTIENPPQDAIQQHSYAIQQWSTLSTIFAMYKHIFGPSKPEIKPEKLIKDNKFLYILLPPLELGDSLVKILGKMIIMTLKEISAIALLGENISIHKTLKSILKDKATPKPFTLVVLDEYGAYPVDGIDLLLAQVRSLNISVVIAVQDFASLQAGGNNKVSQERALANTTKWLLKLEDEVGINWIEKMISEVKYQTTEYEMDAYGNSVAKTDVKIESRKPLSAQKLRDFDNGFSVLLTGSESEGIVYVQSYYRGGKQENIALKRLANIA